MTVISAAEATRLSDLNNEVLIRSTRDQFNRGIETTSARGEKSTIFEKRYFQINLILTEITDAGYTVTDNGTYYTVQWT